MEADPAEVDALAAIIRTAHRQIEYLRGEMSPSEAAARAVLSAGYRRVPERLPAAHDVTAWFLGCPFTDRLEIARVLGIDADLPEATPTAVSFEILARIREHGLVDRLRDIVAPRMKGKAP